MAWRLRLMRQPSRPNTPRPVVNSNLLPRHREASYSTLGKSGQRAAQRSLYLTVASRLGRTIATDRAGGSGVPGYLRPARFSQ
jgi:hypothetical protein